MSANLIQSAAVTLGEHDNSEHWAWRIHIELPAKRFQSRWRSSLFCHRLLTNLNEPHLACTASFLFFL